MAMYYLNPDVINSCNIQTWLKLSLSYEVNVEKLKGQSTILDIHLYFNYAKNEIYYIKVKCPWPLKH